MIPLPTRIAAALEWSALQMPQIETPPLEAQRLLAHALRISRGALLARDDEFLDAAVAEQFAAATLRRAAGEPFAYIVGERDFWSLTLRVTPDVLVPRPETELLVERALLHGGSSQAMRLADLGTGSGCIALALAGERPDWHVTATDCSTAALAVARDNAQRLKLANVEFIAGDWFAALGTKRFDLLVSNPPYIGAAEPALADPALRHEPRTALTPGPDGLAALRTLSQQAPRHLRDGGWLLLEHGAGQAAAVRALLVAQGFGHVTSQRDLAGIERVCEGCWRE
jgi:release factor glutamine methyltransferase